MVICLERDADLHVAQLMPLPLNVTCFSRIQIGFIFLVPAYLASPGKRAVKGVCVRACVCYWCQCCVSVAERSRLRLVRVPSSSELRGCCRQRARGTRVSGRRVGHSSGRRAVRDHTVPVSRRPVAGSGLAAGHHRAVHHRPRPCHLPPHHLPDTATMPRPHLSCSRQKQCRMLKPVTERGHHDACHRIEVVNSSWLCQLPNLMYIPVASVRLGDVSSLQALSYDQSPNVFDGLLSVHKNPWPYKREQRSKHWMLAAIGRAFRDRIKYNLISYVRDNRVCSKTDGRSV